MTSRRARERANARPWEQGEQPEPDDHQAVKDYAAKLSKKRAKTETAVGPNTIQG